MIKRSLGKMLKIYINEADEYNGEPVYSLLLQKFKEIDISGVTMLRGIGGFGVKTKIHSEFVEALLKNLPIVIEVIDEEDKIDEVISLVKLIIPSGVMAIINDVDILKCKNDFSNC